MGMHIECPITGIPDIYAENNQYKYTYTIATGDFRLNIIIPGDYESWLKDPFVIDNRVALAGLMLNGKIIPFKEKTDTSYSNVDLELLKKSVLENSYPVTPEQKINNLFVDIFLSQRFDGDSINTSRAAFPNDSFFFKKYYFKTYAELVFYANALAEDSLLTIDTSNGHSLLRCAITYKGLSHYEKITSEGGNSKNCFIAMSFGENMKAIRTAIKDACNETGYTPILVDEIHYESDVTINDAIIANLKKCRFCVADFTEQKKGVYFESGFAIGQGKQVIYSCRKDDIENSHFDTNHFPHLLYETPEQLKEMLVYKIQAWMR